VAPWGARRARRTRWGARPARERALERTLLGGERLDAQVHRLAGATMRKASTSGRSPTTTGPVERASLAPHAHHQRLAGHEQPVEGDRAAAHQVAAAVRDERVAGEQPGALGRRRRLDAHHRRVAAVVHHAPARRPAELADLGGAQPDPPPRPAMATDAALLLAHRLLGGVRHAHVHVLGRQLGLRGAHRRRALAARLALGDAERRRAARGHPGRRRGLRRAGERGGAQHGGGERHDGDAPGRPAISTPPAARPRAWRG
jgi:hypothetical protein